MKRIIYITVIVCMTVFNISKADPTNITVLNISSPGMATVAFTETVPSSLTPDQFNAIESKLRKDISDVTSNMVSEPTITIKEAITNSTEAFANGFKAGVNADEQIHLNLQLPGIEQQAAELFLKSTQK